MALYARRPSQNEEAPVERMRAASARAREAFAAVARRAKMLSDELDETTSPASPGAPADFLSEEDSAVIMLNEMIGSLSSKI